MFPDNAGQAIVNFETDSNILSSIQRLIFEPVVSPTSLTTYSQITHTQINTAMAAISGSSEPLFRVTGMKMVNGNYPIKFTRHNDLAAFQRNYFKSPSAAEPKYTINADAFRLYPSITSQVIVNVIKTPKTLTVGNSPEFDDYACNQLLTIALQYAQIGTRDEELLASIRNSKVSQ